MTTFNNKMDKLERMIEYIRRENTGNAIEFANKIKKEIQIPVIGVGMITEPEQAEMILQEQKADMVAIARAILYNPRWPWHAAQKLKAKVKCPPQYLRSEPQGVRNLLERDL